VNVLETTGLSKRYGRVWALRDCTLAVPAGTVTALIGPNGAGKSTLLQLVAGLLGPTSGEVRVGGRALSRRGADLARVAFVAQDKPLFPHFTVAETLYFGQSTNPGFDTASARSRLDGFGIAMGTKVGRLSGGQRALVALTLALGKRAELLVLDEPLADLDPLARREVMGALMGAVTETGATVILSSHILADLADTCDYLLLLNGGRLQLAGGFEDVIDAHRVITGPAELAEQLRVAPVPPVHLRTTSRQTTALVRREALGPAFTAGQAPDLEGLVLGYLRNPEASWLPTPRLVDAGEEA
jgi:ABC-2 type transport system ATP-binding protein